MTKEELEKEARKKSLSYNTKYAEDSVLDDMLSRPQDFIDGAIADMVDLLRKKAYRDGLIDSAEPREKQIQIDAEQIRALQKQNGELTDKVKELESQIEKMKCCGNCKYCGTPCTHPSDEICEDLDKWELAD